MAKKKITIVKNAKTSAAPFAGADSSLRAGTSTSALDKKKVKVTVLGTKKAAPEVEEPVKKEPKKIIIGKKPVAKPANKKKIILVSKTHKPVEAEKNATPVIETVEPATIAVVEQPLVVSAPSENISPVETTTVVASPIVIPVQAVEEPTPITEEPTPISEEPIAVEEPVEEIPSVEPIAKEPAEQLEEPLPVEEENSIVALVKKLQSEGLNDEEVLLALAKMVEKPVEQSPVEEPVVEEEPVIVEDEQQIEETPVIEEPVTEETIEEESLSEEPTAEEIIPVEETEALEEENVLEEAPVDEQLDENPVEEPVENVEEPVAEEPVSEEPVVESTPVEEPVEETQAVEETPEQVEEPVVEEPTPVEEENNVIAMVRKLQSEGLSDEEVIKALSKTIEKPEEEPVEEDITEDFSPIEEEAPVEESEQLEEDKVEETTYSDMDQDADDNGEFAKKALKGTGYVETVLKDGPIEKKEEEPAPVEEEEEKEEEEELVISEEKPRKFDVESKPVEPVAPYDYVGKNKIVEDSITSAIEGDEEIARLSELLNAGSVHTLRFKRQETGSFDMTWIRAIEDAIPAIDEILKNPRINTKIVTDIVPVELAKKTGSESVKHLASHTQYVKDIDEDGNVIPSKILNIGSDDEYLTYENRFVATAIRRLVIFVEKRYEYLTKYSNLKDYEILYIKNHATVNGLDVDVQSKVIVSRPSHKGSSVEEAEDIMRRINLLRRYAKFFYASDFMKRFKNEKNVRTPIMQTNIIRKNPKYHKVYNLFRFMESYAALGVEFTTKENYFGVEATDKQAITNITLANFLAVKCDPTSQDVTTKVEVKNPQVLTDVDDDVFTFFPVGAYPEFIRIDDEYIKWKERNTSDLKEKPSPEEKAYRGNDYLRKAKAEKERARREALIERRKAIRDAFLAEQEELKRQAEEERKKQERLAREAEENAALAELEEAREFVRNSAYNEDEDLLLATVIPIEITIKGEHEITAKTTYAQLETIVEFFISDPSLIWTSSNESVATVDDTGYVSGWKEGDVTIRATSVEDPTCFKDFEMHVLPRPAIEVYIEPIEKIIVSKEVTLVPLVRHADDTSVIWSTSNAAVASVENGVVKAHSIGRCIVTAYSVEDNRRSCSIVVEPLNGIDLSVETDTIVSKRTTVDVIAHSNMAEDDMIMFFSSDDNIATVNQNGYVEGVSWDGGDVTITAVSTLDPSISSKIELHVLPKPIVSVELSGRAIAVLGRSHQLSGNVINAVDSTALWSSSNEDILTVDENGVVTGHELGIATITCASYEEKDKVATIEIEVKEAVIISSPNFEVVSKKSMQLSSITNVTDDDTVMWSSSNEDIATIDENGVVTGVSSGDVIIKASSVYDPTLYADYELHVRPEVEIKISGTARAIATKCVEFAAEVLYAYDPSYRFESSDSEIITIDDKGVAEALKKGVATITATSLEDETKTDSIEVTVVDGVELYHEIESVVATHSVSWVAKSNLSESDTILWTSSNLDVALVNQEGLIRGIGAGVATITATSNEDSTLSSSFEIKVVPAIEIELTGTPVVIKDRNGSISANVINATDPSLVYTSSDENVVTVCDDIINGIGVGKATITATSVEDDSRFATFDVEVKDGIELECEVTHFVALKETLSLTAKTNIDGDSVVWSSSDESVALVEGGVVRAANPLGGNVVIRASSSADGEIYKEVEILVEPKPSIEVSLVANGLLILGETLQLEATIINADDTTLIYSSSNNNVATVDSNGVVSAASCGEVTISATSKEDSSKSATLTLNVLSGIIVESFPECISVGRRASVVAHSNIGENDTLIYAVNKENVAKVDSNGIITAYEEGDVELSITSSLDMMAVEMVTIHVKPAVTLEIKGEDKVVIRKNIELSSIVENAVDCAVLWSSADENIASVDDNGVVTGNEVGYTRIVATSMEDPDVKSEHLVEVLGPIAIEEHADEVMVGNTLRLNACSYEGDDDKLSWSSSDESVASVDDSGNVIGLKEGVTTITVVSTIDPLAKIECVVTVIPKSEIQIEIYGTNKLYVGKESTFTAFVDNADDQTIVWSTSDETIATVSQDGVVTPLAPGNASICVTSKEDETKYACLEFVVVDGVVITGDISEVCVGDSIVWDAKTGVSEDDTVTWASSDENIAIVRKGMITGVQKGEATIVATSTGDSSLSCSKTVKVIKKDEVEPVPEAIDEVSPNDDSSVEEDSKNITISCKRVELFINETIKIDVIGNLEDGDQIVWSTSDRDVATISEDGVVRGVSSGAVTIAASSLLNPELRATETLFIKDLVYDLDALNDWYIDDDDDEFTAALLKGAEEEKQMENIREKK